MQNVLRIQEAFDLPRIATVLQCLLISPSDLNEDRDALVKLVEKWNGTVGRQLGVRIDLVRWEVHAVPDLAGSGQIAINQQLVDSSDFAIALFWSRLGTETLTHASGSIEEVERLRERGARVLVYRCDRPISPSNLDGDQFARLESEMSRLRDLGLVGNYTEASALVNQVNIHLTVIATETLTREDATLSDVSASAPDVASAPIPDVRIRLRHAYQMGGDEASRELVSVGIENHSPQPVFTGHISIALKGEGGALYPAFDAATGQPQTRRRLSPGESYNYYLLPTEILKRADPDQIADVVFYDDVGREYRAKAEEVESELRAPIRKLNK